MIVVFDTNIWLSQLGLRSGMGAVVRFYLKNQGAKIGLPEVIKLETEKHLRRSLNEFIEGIVDNHRQLLTIFGALKEISLPDTAAVEAKVNSVFADLGVDVVSVPFSLESARSSFLKVIAGEPPNGEKNQQFKDGVIWADCLKLLDQDDVHLVTDDRAFYKDRQPNLGLASNLKEELKGKPHKLTIHLSVADLVEKLKADVPVDANALWKAIQPVMGGALAGLLNRHGFELRDLEKAEIARFVTESPDRLYVEFNLRFNALDIRDGDRTNSHAAVSGDAMMNPSTGEFSEIRPSGETIEFRLPDGTDQRFRNQYLRAGIAVIGHREVSNTVRERLD